MMDSYHSGIDYFTGDIDKPIETDLACKACGVALKAVKVNGPRSWAGAMANLKSDHWSYTCPNTRHDGHEYLVDLYLEHGRLFSSRLQALVELDLDMERRAFLEKVNQKKVGE